MKKTAGHRGEQILSGARKNDEGDGKWAVHMNGGGRIGGFRTTASRGKVDHLTSLNQEAEKSKLVKKNSRRLQDHCGDIEENNRRARENN